MRNNLNKQIIVNIYELRDPTDIECNIRYIGITSQSLRFRLHKHINEAKKRKNKTYKNNWIYSLLRNGIKPTIHLIEQVFDWNYACEVEKYYIKEFKEQGYKLTNGTIGGDGVAGITFIMTEETKEKIRKTLTGYKRTNENRTLLMTILKTPILQYDLNMNFIKEWESITKACVFYNNNNLGNITKCCKGERKTAGGFIWKYKNK